MTTDVITENTTAQNATADNLYTGLENSFIRESSPTSNRSGGGAGGTLEIASFNPANDNNHSLLRADGLSNISSGATVSAATLYLYQTANNGSAYSVDLRRMLQAWVGSSATWNTYDGTNNWNTAGAEGAGTDRVSAVESATSIGTTNSSYYGLDCTSLVQDIIDGTIASDEGFHVAVTSPTSGFYKVFAASEGTDGQRPELVVVYTAGGGGGIEILRRRIEGY